MLSEAMIGAAGDAAGALRKIPDLEAIAMSLVGRGKSAWPKMRVDAQAFVAHVGARLSDAPDAKAALDELHVEDMWLAYACGRGDKSAIAELDRQLRPVVDGALARMKGRAPAEDVAQLLREKLLVAKGAGGPKILDYSGRGPLGGWIRIAAVRTALSMGRHGDAAAMRPVTREMLLEVPAVSADPELDHLRKRYAKDFKAAFESALASLSVEERNLLRLSLVDGLSIDEIGGVFGVHRATAARKLARAKEVVQQQTRKILTERLDLASAELRSIMGYLKSHLDLSIQRLLVDEETPPSPAARKSSGGGARKKTGKKR